MKVPISKLLVNRSQLTRDFGVNGSPVMQMATHVPMFGAIIGDAVGGWKRWGKYSYNSVLESSQPGTRRQKTDTYLVRLIRSIDTEGIKKPLAGWNLNSNGFVELYGGHHRAVVAAVLGHVEINVKLWPFDMFHNATHRKLKKVLEVYRQVPQCESLQIGQCYNPFPGLKPIRGTAQMRLEKIYREIIDCHGSSLLDLGCNDGFFGANLSVHDFQVTFVDRSSAYMKVVHAKMDVVQKDAVFAVFDIDEYFAKYRNGKFDVIVYLDVFYHTVLEKGVDAGMDQLKHVIDRTRERLIIAPGRWDKLEAAGCTERMVYDVLRKDARQIRYLGTDDDPHYHRDIYSIYY